MQQSHSASKPMDAPLYVLPESPPDEGDFVFVAFNREWWTVVLAGVRSFRDNSLWVDGEINDAEGQIDQLLDLLMTDLDPPP